jgi:hypothetical protein
VVRGVGLTVSDCVSAVMRDAGLRCGAQPPARRRCRHTASCGTIPGVDGGRVAREFGLGRPVSDPTEAASGLMGTVWRLRTDRGDYAVKEVRHALDERRTAGPTRPGSAAAPRSARRPAKAHWPTVERIRIEPVPGASVTIDPMTPPVRDPDFRLPLRQAGPPGHRGLTGKKVPVTMTPLS